GSLASFTVMGLPGTNNTFTWQLSTDGGTNYSALVNGGAYTIINVSSNNSSTLVISNTVVAQNDYRVRITLGSFVSAPAVLGVHPLAVIYVTATADGANDGTSWTNAYTNFYNAIAVAVACSQVWAARGTYTAGDLSSQLRRNVRIYGGFSGNE